MQSCISSSDIKSILVKIVIIGIFMELAKKNLIVRVRIKMKFYNN